MTSGGLAELDFIEELRLRRWAREHYVPRGKRQKSWHPVVHEEMAKKDTELTKRDMEPNYRDAQPVFAHSYR
ncbi:MAG TPA: hypothetical protein VFA18_25165 [Gemmataceae bacterium]|nr:hypothetical protein [Gemmataceae bacterium]